MANGSPAPASGFRVGFAVLVAEVLLLLEVERSAAVVVSCEESDVVEIGPVSVCDSVSELELESVDVELAVGVVVNVEVNVVVDVVSVYKGDVLEEAGLVVVMEDTGVVDGVDGVDGGCVRVEVCFGGTPLQSAFTKFPLCASPISEPGGASTVSHDARMLVSTRCSARLQFDEHCPLVKSPISHPLIGVL